MVSVPLYQALLLLVLSGAIITGITFIVYVIKRKAGYKFWDMIREKDFHPSLSRFQFLLWTWIVAFVFAGVFFIRASAGLFPLPPEIPSNLLLLLGISAAPPAISSGVNQVRYSAGIQRVKNDLKKYGKISQIRNEFRTRNGGPSAAQLAQDNAASAQDNAARAAAQAARDASIADFAVARAQASQQAVQFAAQVAPFGGIAAQNTAAQASQQAAQMAVLAVQAQATAQNSQASAIQSQTTAQTALQAVPSDPDISLADIFDEDGKPAMTRFQMFVWTFVAIIAYFIILGMTLSSMLVGSLLTGVENLTIPNIDTTMLTLMGVSQGAYVAGKAAKST